MGRDWISFAVSLALVTGLPGLGFMALRTRIDYRRKQAWRRRLERHRAPVTKRDGQLLRLNEDGFEEREKWHQELTKFRMSVGLSLKNCMPFEA